MMLRVKKFGIFRPASRPICRFVCCATARRLRGGCSQGNGMFVGGHAALVAETFALFHLGGTPSTVLIDPVGIVRDITFGQDPDLENKILGLLGRW